MAKLPPSFAEGVSKAGRELGVTFELPVPYHGLTAAQRVEVRQEYIERQGGACWLCKAPLDEDPCPSLSQLKINWRQFPGDRSGTRYPVHLHHCHKTGLTEGAVHAHCNAAMWQYLGV